MGSIRVARRAGTSAATRAQAMSAPAAAPRISGSPLRTPKSWLRSMPPAHTATGRPMARPQAICARAPCRIMAMTAGRVAPSAVRMPISLVRLATAYAVTP